MIDVEIDELFRQLRDEKQQRDLDREMTRHLWKALELAHEVDHHVNKSGVYKALYRILENLGQDVDTWKDHGYWDPAIETLTW